MCWLRLIFTTSFQNSKSTSGITAFQISNANKFHWTHINIRKTVNIDIKEILRHAREILKWKQRTHPLGGFPFNWRTPFFYFLRSRCFFSRQFLWINRSNKVSVSQRIQVPAFYRSCITEQTFSRVALFR